MIEFLAGALTAALMIGLAVVLTEDWGFRAAQLRGRRAVRRRRGCSVPARPARHRRASR
ncbi:MAG: hypothetical protein ACRDRK_10820 [Pseudonocardia sp.]